ncbi:MAG: hypothetical protein WD991_02185 [Candidatus Paceibacterota bacterium]
MNEGFSQPNTGAHREVPNSDFIGVINSLALSAEKKKKIIQRVERLKELHWSNNAIENELEIRFHIKKDERKNPPKKPL